MTILISGGGTGGHIFPAIAIANELKNKYAGCEIIFVGAKGRMEMERVPKAGYKIIGLWITGIQRKISLKNFLFPLKLIYSLLKSYFIIKKYTPDLVIGTGGFASGPLLYVASLLNIKTVIQEQNSFPGITNKILAKKVSRILCAYREATKFFPASKVVVTGNPIRGEFFENTLKTDALNFYNLKGNKKTLLVLGGSLGSKYINEILFKNLDEILSYDIQILWQCGKFYYQEYSKKINSDRVRLYSFLENMSYAYKVSDLVISRAGAIALSEITVLGKPSILVPSPNVAEDHQTKNASVLQKNKACILVKEKDLDKKLHKTVAVIKDKEILNSISKNALRISEPYALEKIIQEIDVLIKK